MNVPPIIYGFELPKTREPRNYLGWILLALLCLLMILGATALYASRSKPEQQGTAICDDALQAAVQAPTASKTRLWKAFDRDVKRRFLHKNVFRLALFRSVGAYERGLPIAPEDIVNLRNSRDTRERNLAWLYGSSKLNQVQVKRYTRVFDTPEFVYKLASVHAREKVGDRTARKMIAPMIAKPPANSNQIFETLVLSGIVIGLVIIGLYVGLRFAGLLKPLGHPLDGISLYGADRCALRFSQIFLLMMGVEIACLVLPWLGASRTLSSLISQLVMVLSVIGLSFSPVLRDKIGYSELGLTRERLGQNVLWGIAGALANIPVFFAVAIFSNALFRGLPQVEHSIVNELKTASDALTILTMFVTASLVAPIIEETMFRGLLLPAFAKVTRSRFIAIAITTTLFAMFHATGIPSWLPIATIGCTCALLTYQTRSLLPAMILHAMHNGIMLLVFLLLGK